MARVFADDANNTIAADDAAKFAEGFYGRTDSHRTIVCTGENRRLGRRGVSRITATLPCN